MYLIVLLPNYKRMYDQIDQIEKNKLELFIANWSYSYDLKRVFATYQRMRANRTYWAGTRPMWLKLCTEGTEVTLDVIIIS